MNYVLHICDPAGFVCTGGNDNPQTCEVDSIHQSACQTCLKYPTDPEILRLVAEDHALYLKDPGREKSVSYRDKRNDKFLVCQCPILNLWRDGHQKGCPEKKK